MICRSLLTITFILTIFLHTLNAIHPDYFREGHEDDLMNPNSNDIDEERSMFVLKPNHPDNEDDLIKRNKYPNFYLSPLWLSRRTRSSRLYGKPLWISRTGR